MMQPIGFLSLILVIVFSLGACALPGLPPSAGIVAVTPLPAVVEPASATATPRPPATVVAPPRATTPTPWDIALPAGSAAAIAAATDVALQPTPRTRLFFDTDPVRLRFDDFYDGYNIRSGLILSDKLVSLDGQRVVIEGYMAPPLKPELDFFVLTRIRLAYCPFCTTAADWPDDIAVVYLLDGTTVATISPLRITGRLEVGASVDTATGMVSLVRIYAEEMEELS
jgi:hypothetical protein